MKSPLLSKTLWINGLTVAAAVLTALSGMSDQIPPVAMPWIITALGAVNMLLRVITTKPLAL